MDNNKRYIRFGSARHSYSNDYGLYIASCVKVPPERQEQTETIPYHDGSLDLSYHYDNTDYYNDGQLIYTLERLVKDSEEYLYWQKRITTWLYSTPEEATTSVYGVPGKDVLHDSAIPGYYLMAKCTALSFAKDGRKMTVTATFSVHPYLVQDTSQKGLEFNDMDFETDYLNKLTFTPTLEATEGEEDYWEAFDIYYPWTGRSGLTITNNSAYTVTVSLNGKTVTLESLKKSKGYLVLLPKQRNTLTITCKTAYMGNTKVDFNFVRKEVF